MIEEVNFDISNADQDTIIWTRTSSGEYTAKSAYDMPFDGGLASLFPKMVWKVWAPSKCKFFMWLLLQNRVWTADRLLQREWPNSYFCPMCRRNLETALHLFSECPISQKVWREISKWANCPSLDPIQWNAGAMQDWFQAGAGGGPGRGVRVGAAGDAGRPQGVILQAATALAAGLICSYATVRATVGEGS